MASPRASPVRPAAGPSGELVTRVYALGGHVTRVYSLSEPVTRVHGLSKPVTRVYALGEHVTRVVMDVGLRGRGLGLGAERFGAW